MGFGQGFLPFLERFMEKSPAFHVVWIFNRLKALLGPFDGIFVGRDSLLDHHVEDHQRLFSRLHDEQHEPEEDRQQQ